MTKILDGCIPILMPLLVYCAVFDTRPAFFSLGSSRKKKLKKVGAANYIMMVVFHLGFLLPQTVLAHLDGAEASLDH